MPFTPLSFGHVKAVIAVLASFLLLASASPTQAQAVRETFDTDPLAGGRFTQQTVGTESSFVFRPGNLTATLDVDASPAFLISKPFDPLTDVSNSSFSAKFRIDNLDEADRPTAFIGLMTDQHVGDFGDGLLMVLSAANGALVAHADIESFDQSFAGSAILLEQRTDYLVTGRYRGATRQLAIEIFRAPEFTNLVGFSTAVLPPGRTLTVNRVGLQNGGARDLDSPVGSLTVALDDLFAPGIDLRRVSISDALVTEGDAGLTNASFKVQLSLPSSLPISVNFSTADGSAEGGSDYVAQSGTLIFAPGVTSMSIDVPVIGDLLSEGVEDFGVNLADAVDASIQNARGIGTILDNDPRPLLSIADAAGLEGDSGAGSLEFVVTLANASGQPVTVDYATANGAATAGQDYVAQSGTLTFTAGQTTRRVTIQINGDPDAEGDESFFVRLSSPQGATLLKGQGTGTIFDDDSQRRLSINDIVLVEGNSGFTTNTFTVTLTRATTAEVSVDYTVVSGTATVGTDLLASSGRLTFPAGVTRASLTVVVVGDTAPEADESFTVNLSNPSNNATIAKAAGMGLIRNDDAFPELLIEDAKVTEGDSGTQALEFIVRLSSPIDRSVTVSYATADGTALAGLDYLSATNTVTFRAGTAAQTISIPIVGDVLNEPDETLSVSLFNPTLAAVGRGRAVGTILDNDAPPSISVEDITVAEGDSATVNAAFTIRLSSAGGQPVNVSYSTADGTATAGSDYIAKFGTVTFPPGQTTAQVSVAVNGDTKFEPDQFFLLRLSSPANGVLVKAEARCVIRNDDPLPTISIADAVGTETTGGALATFEATLSIASAEAVVTVSYATADGSATDGSDYEGDSGLISFAPGATQATVSIPVRDDSLPEADENFFINLSGPSNGQLANVQATGTIRDNDAIPRILLRDAEVAEGDAGASQLVFNLELDQPSGSPVTATFTTRDGTATAASNDYVSASGQVRFEPGRTNATLAIVVNGDTAVEPDETLVVDLTQLVNAAEGRIHAIGTLLDDDTRKLSINDVVVTEGKSGTSTNAVFAIRLNKPVADTVTVNYSTADGSATSGVDYLPTNGVLTFPPGVLSREVVVTVIGDDFFEPDETFLVNLRGAVNAALGDNQGVGTIRNDDDSVFIIADGMTLDSEDCTPNNGVIDPGETVTAWFALKNIGTIGSSTVVARLLTGPGVIPISAAQNYGVLPRNSDSVSRPFAFKATGECGDSVQAVLQIENGGTNYGNVSFSFRLGREVNGQPVCCQSADVEVSVREASPSVVLGQDAAYTLQVTNRGPATATRLMMTNAWRASVNVRSAQPSQGACVVQGESVVCDLGNLDAGKIVTLEMVVTPRDVGPLIGVYYARALEHEPNAANNSAASSTIVNAPPGLSIGDCRVHENGSGGLNALFSVRLSPTTGRPVTASFATLDGSARAGEDYVPTNGTVTIPKGSALATISVPILNDTNLERDETFFLTLSNPVGAELAAGQSTGTATIVDDDVPELTVEDVTLAEPPAGTRMNLSFVLRLSAQPERPVTVDYATSDGTATRLVDYFPALGTAAFAAGETEFRVEVEVAGDAIAEREETFFLNLSNPVGAHLGRSQIKATLVDDAFLPELSIRGVAVPEGRRGETTSAVLALALSRPSTRPVEVDYATADGTARGGGDFVIGAGKVQFAPGETNANVTVAIYGDDTPEFNETFLVRLTNAVYATLAIDQAQGTIVNDDYLPLLLAGPAQVRLENCEPPNRAIDPLETVTVDLGLLNRGLGPTTNLTASLRAGPHVIPLSNAQTYGVLPTNGVAAFRPFTLSIDGACGETYTVELELRDNGLLAGVVPFEFTLGTLVNGKYLCCSGADLSVGIVATPEPVVLLSALECVISITNQGPSMATGILLTNRFSAPVQLLSSSLSQWNCSLTNGELVCGVGDLFPGESVRVTNVVSPAELPSLVTFVLVGSNEQDPNPTDNRAVAASTVVPPLGISMSDSTVVEGDADHPVELAVLLSPPRAEPVTVDYDLVEGTAKLGQDFLSASGTLTFAPGQTVAALRFTVKGDLFDEADETVFINLRNPVNTLVARPQVVCTIVDDDAPALSIGDVSVNVGTNTAMKALLTVSLSSPSADPVQFEYYTSNGTATAGTDYASQRETLTIPAGMTSTTLAIPVSGNTADEGQEYFLVSLTNAVNASLPTGPGTVTITDEAPADLVISDASVVEGDSGRTEAVFRVTLRSALAHLVTVDYFTSDGSALAGADYLATKGALSFPPGILEQRVAVPIVGDLAAEPTEVFYVNLTNALNAVPRDRQGVGTIQDNDPEPCLSIADVTVAEGNSETNSAGIRLSLSAPSSQSVRVEAFWANCASASPATAVFPISIVFLPGQTQTVVPIPIPGDLLDEPDEICTIQLTNAVNAKICRGVAQLTIVDDDPAPGLEISNVSINEGNVGARTASFAVALIGATRQTISVRFASSDGSATAQSDYLPVSGVLTFPPGMTSTNVAVRVNGDTLVEADETFTVGLSQPSNAVLFRATGIGTIVNDDSAPQADCPGVVVLATPGDQACFEPFTPINLVAIPDEAAEKVQRMEFYSGPTLLGVDTSSPFEIVWGGAPVGDYCLTARAICASGRAVESEPTCIGVTDRGAPVAIVRNFDDPEINHLREYLLEMGYCARVFDQAGLTEEDLTSYWLVIWDDLGAEGLTPATAQILSSVFDYGIPVYLIGDHLASAASLNPESRDAWFNLLHLTPLGRTIAPGVIAFSSATADRQPGSILSGRFSEIEDFTYERPVALSTARSDATSLGSSNGGDLLVQYPSSDVTDFGQPRTVSQSFRVTGGGDDSLSARKALFQNSVCWLLRCSFCPLVYLSVHQTDFPERVNVGDEFTFSIAVGNNGECIAFATIVTNRLPSALSLVDFSYNKGTSAQYNPQDRTLVWRVGSVVSGTENNAILTMSVKALQPGDFKGSACAVANYEIFSESNCAEFELRIEGEGPLEPPSLSMVRNPGAPLQLRLSGHQGGSYQIQSSPDLLNWLPLTNAVGPLFLIQVPEASIPGNHRRFYRAR